MHFAYYGYIILYKWGNGASDYRKCRLSFGDIRNGGAVRLRDFFLEKKEKTEILKQIN